MSWMQKLYETYENCSSIIGRDVEDEVPLLPVDHTIQNAHIQIVIDSEGNFLRASVVPKSNAQTIIPCTEDSAGRTGITPACHPLCDNLQFVAGDFIEYGGVVTSGYLKNPKEPHETYIERLDKWCKSDKKHEKAISVLTYLKKKKVIVDLISAGILFLDNGKLIEKTKQQIKEYFGSEKNIPEIFRVIPPDKNKIICMSKAFVRWCVEKQGEPQSEVWRDTSLWESWSNYYAEQESIKGLCYISGEKTCLAKSHPKRIRTSGDKAKLISSNDENNFTFRGRFITAEQACGVSSEITQKAHSALRWLISRQGYRNGDQVIVAWATSGKAVPNPLENASSILDENELVSDDLINDFTGQYLAIELKKKIAGYSVELGPTTNVVVMGLDSVVPGRMAVTFYRELTGSDFLERLNKWHESCTWIHNYGYSKEKKRFFRFVGAPSPKDIAEVIYGTKSKDNLKKMTKMIVDRVLPCIIEGRKIPRDMVESVVNRACNGISLKEGQWEKALSIACALFRKLKEKEEYNMALEENRKTRDYLYGRLFALAESLEQWALNKAGEDRQTNCARLMQRFAEHPYSTWRTIELLLTPYKTMLGVKSRGRQELIDEVAAMFTTEDFINDRRLTGEFLLGYHCQREFLRPKVSNNIKEKKSDIKNNNKKEESYGNAEK